MQPHIQTPLEESKVKDIQISLFKDCKAISSTAIDVDSLFNLIRIGKGFKTLIEQIRTTTEAQERDELKKRLPAVTLSGLFDKARKKEHLTLYSGLMQIDLDKVENIAEIRAKLEKDKYSFAVFLSPSGKGLKVIVKVVNELSKHLQCFLELEKHFVEKYSLQIDKSCKDVTRLMFLSWDESLFVNKKSIVFLPVDNFELKTFNSVFNSLSSKQEVKQKIKEEKKIKNKKKAVFLSENDFEIKEFEKTINYLNEKEVFTDGNRNNYLFKLASLCSQREISIDFTVKKCLEKFETIDFAEKEIKTTIKSAFKNSSNSPKNKIESKKVNSEKGFSKIKQIEDYINSNYELRNNEVSCKIEFRKKGTQENLKELNEHNIFRDLSHNNLDYSLNKLKSLLNSDFIPVFNPFKTFFDELKKWDSHTEIDFIEKLTSFIPVKNPERFKKHFKKMLVRCIACALEDSVFNKQAFILVHEQQNSGKSTFCRWLCPPELRDYIAENINTDKDSQIALATNFLINMDELATLSKSDINTLKSFLSKDKINVRLPYDSRTTIKPRRANFIGSTNKDEFLSDETGSVRWLCFELTGKINFDYKDKINVNDIWRQAYTLYKEGFAYQLTTEEIAENEEANRQFLINTSEMDLIPKYFKPGTRDNHDLFLNATAIQSEIAVNNQLIKLTPYAIGKALKILGFVRGTDYNENTKQSVKGYYVFKA